MMENKLELVEAKIHTKVAEFLYLDRKNDGDLTFKDLKKLIDSGQLTKEMIIQWFTEMLTDNWES